jgi:predicted RNase H-like HicB family nuclease
MHYDAFIRREGKHVLADFPDCPGCQTFADSGDELVRAAQEALEGWLEANLVRGKIPPRPIERSRAPVGAKLARVPVRAGLAAALAFRWARHDQGLTQAELGKIAGVTQQHIAKLENPEREPIARDYREGRARDGSRRTRNPRDDSARSQTRRGTVAFTLGRRREEVSHGTLRNRMDQVAGRTRRRASCTGTCAPLYRTDRARSFRSTPVFRSRGRTEARRSGTPLPPLPAEVLAPMPLKGSATSLAQT